MLHVDHSRHAQSPGSSLPGTRVAAHGKRAAPLLAMFLLTAQGAGASGLFSQPRVRHGAFSYLKFTKYVTNIIAEPKYKYRQQEQVTVRNHNRSTALERSVLNAGGGELKPALREPNLALSFYHSSKHTVV